MLTWRRYVLRRVLGVEHPVDEQRRGAGRLGVGRDRHAVRADRDALLARLELVVLGVLLGLVARVDDVAVPGVVDPRGAAQQLRGSVGRVAAQELLLLLKRGLRLLQLGLAGGVEVEAVEEVRLADALLEVVEHERLALGALVREVVPGAGDARELVVAPRDPGRVHRVRHRVGGAGVVPRVVQELEDPARVRSGARKIRLTGRSALDSRPAYHACTPLSSQAKSQ